MNAKPIAYEIERAITRFVIQHPGVNPKHILLELPNVVRVHQWMISGGASVESRTGVTESGDLIIYGLVALKAPPGTGITVVGYSGPFK